MYKLVLLRHGESEGNEQNRFTGWTDVDLTTKGEQEAIEAGVILQEQGYVFDRAYTSVLKRAIKTLYHVLDEMNLLWIPVHKSWKLNERHYGALQGLNKAETAARYGEKQVHLWRRSYDILPPELSREDHRYARFDPRYKDVEAEELPLAESLKETVERVVPFYEKEIVSRIQCGEKILIAAHGNSLRALVKHLDNMGDEEVLKLNIPTGIPLVYEFDDKLNPIRHYYLGNPNKIQSRIEAVEDQGKKKTVSQS